MKRITVLVFLAISCSDKKDPAVEAPEPRSGIYETDFVLDSNSCKDLDIPDEALGRLGVTPLDDDETEFELFLEASKLLPRTVTLTCDPMPVEEDNFSCTYHDQFLGTTVDTKVIGFLGNGLINGLVNVTIVEVTPINREDYKTKEEFLNALLDATEVCSFRYIFEGEKVENK